MKCIRLKWLWRGEIEDWNRRFEKEDEQSLLGRKYMFWSSKLKGSEVTTVGAIMKDAVEQIKKYMDIFAKGNPETYNDIGV